MGDYQRRSSPTPVVGTIRVKSAEAVVSDELCTNMGESSLHRGHARTCRSSHRDCAGWSRNVLVHHIDTEYHQRAGKAITNFVRTLPPEDSDLAQQATRDPCLFDYVGIGDIRLEHDLESALADHVEKFLLELGQGVAFVGRQVHLHVGNTDFCADLLFYHSRLRCFVVSELKVGDFDLSYLGIYMAAVDDLMRHSDAARTNRGRGKE